MSVVPARPPAVPPRDVECGAVLASLPPFPELTLATIAQMRQPPLGIVLPDHEDLARDTRFVATRHLAPGIADGQPDVELTVCRPAGTDSTEALPALYTVHGGGMIAGNAVVDLPPVLDLADQLGAVVVAVDYRLAPEHPHPAPVQDCHAGWRWLTANAAAFGVDVDRIVLHGVSAGGGLAAALAHLVRDQRERLPFGQMLLAPMLDDRNDSWSVRQMSGVDTWDEQRNLVGWTALLGDARGGPDVSSYAAPSRAVDLSGLPAAYLDVGSAETFRDEVVDYASRIWRAGGVAELHVWPGGFHGYDMVAPRAALSMQTRAARLAWLRRLLS